MHMVTLVCLMQDVEDVSVPKEVATVLHKPE